jgi:hypothetical protein
MKRFILIQIATYIFVASTVRLVLGPTVEPNWALSLGYISLIFYPLWLNRKSWTNIVSLSFATALWIGAICDRLIRSGQIDVVPVGYLESFPWFYLSLACLSGLMQFLFHPMETNKFRYTDWSISICAIFVSIASFVQLELYGNFGIDSVYMQALVNIAFGFLISHPGAGGALRIDHGKTEVNPDQAYSEWEKAA